MNINISLYGEDEELCTIDCSDESKYGIRSAF